MKKWDENRKRPGTLRWVGLVAALLLAVGSVGTGSAAPPLIKAKVKKIAKKQIKKLVPKMIDAATLDQGTIAPVTASTNDPNVPIFTKGPFTISLDCSDAGGDVILKLVVRTTEEDSVVNGGFGIRGDLDPADGDQLFANIHGQPPGGDAVSREPYYQAASFRSPSGTHFYAQFDSIANYQGNHCFADGWFLDLATGTGGKVATPGGTSPVSAPLSSGGVKRIAKRQIKKLAPVLIDKATIDQGTIAPVTSGPSGPNVPIFAEGPFTVSLDCSLTVGGEVNLKLLVRTTEESSLVNDASGHIGGDLDPGDGDRVFTDYTGYSPDGGPFTGAVFDEGASFRSPGGTHRFVQFDTATNMAGHACFVDGWFLDLDDNAPTIGAAKVPGGAIRPASAAGLAGGDVKRIVKKQIKKLVPKLADEATIDQGTIPPVTASVGDPPTTMFTKGPFTVSLACTDNGGNVELAVTVRTTEENSVVNGGYGLPAGDLDPADGEVMAGNYTGNAPGSDALNGEGIFYEDAAFRSPSGTHFWGQFDTMTNLQGNHCYADGWFLDLAG